MGGQIKVGWVEDGKQKKGEGCLVFREGKETIVWKMRCPLQVLEGP